MERAYLIGHKTDRIAAVPREAGKSPLNGLLSFPQAGKESKSFSRATANDWPVGQGRLAPLRECASQCFRSISMLSSKDYSLG